MMKKTLISAALIGLVAVAAPAAAQYRNNDSYGYGYQGGDARARIQRIDQRVERLAQNGRLSRREVYRLRGEVDRLQYLERRYSSNGLTRWEREDLQRRIQSLSAQVREDRQDRWNGNDRHDRDDRWDRGNDRRWDRNDDDDDDDD